MVRWPWQREPRRRDADGPDGPIGYTGDRLILDPARGRWFDAGGNATAAARMLEVLDRRAPAGGPARAGVVEVLADALDEAPPAGAAEADDGARTTFSALLGAAYSRLGPTRAEMLVVHAVRDAGSG